MPRPPRLQDESAIDAKRTRRIGHLYQGRYRAFPIAGGDPQSAYRRCVKAGLRDEADPAIDRCKDWGDGSEAFLRKLLQMADRPDRAQDTQQATGRSQSTVAEILRATVAEYGVAQRMTAVSAVPQRVGTSQPIFVRCYTTATLTELSKTLGLSHRDRSSDLVKPAQAGLQKRSEMKQRVRQLEKRLSKNPEFPD